LRHFDESDARVRPNPRGSRPRSKQRPDHTDALDGWVIGVDRGRYLVHGVGDSDTTVTAVTAREMGRGGVVIGDRVRVVGDVGGGEGTLARIVSKAPRERVLRRTADDVNATERVIVANADRLAVVASLAEPEPNRRMIDRCLVAAFDAGLEAALFLTKADLASAVDLRAAYEPLGVTVVESRLVTTPARETTPVGPETTIVGLESVAALLRDSITVLVGPSGVGKSTLVNALVPTASRATGEVNEVTGRGRHTSSSTVVLPLPGGGWIIDTPGVRSFGLGHVAIARVIAAFDDIAEAAAQCPRGCSHLSAADGCTLDAWADTQEGVAGSDARIRLDSLRRLLARRAGAEPS
jgi:ribosome biogenesis GTPase